MESQSFSVGVSQIITKNLILSGQYEVITDEGFLRSPYRSVRFFIDPFTQGQQSEIYPNTRSSNAASIRAKYFLPYRAAIDTMYRFYTDTWGVLGHTGELGYVHPLDNALGRQLDLRRPRALLHADQPPTSTRTSSRAPTTPTSWRATRNSRPTTRSPPASRATYEFKIERFPWLSKGQLNLRYDYMTVNYDDFRDARLQPRQLRHPAGRSAAAGHRAAVQAATPTSSSSTSPRSSKWGHSPFPSKWGRTC